MKAGAAFVDVLRNRRIGRGRFEQLELRLSCGQKMRADALAADVLAVLDLQAERVAEKGERARELRDGNADVVESRVHRRARLRMSAAAV
jgi:hypothetical protein